jgi:photosystem II stability/assembly factor-like uncharacterized protein
MGVLVALLTWALVPLMVPADADASPPSIASTWHTHLDATGSTSFTDVSCPTARVCTAVGGGATGRGAIYRSADGGGIWSRQPVPDSTPGLLAVSCPSTSRCLAVGNGPYEPVFLSTTNGGASWSTLTGKDLFPYYVYGLDCPSLTTCYAALQGGLARSVNGGASWTELPWSNSLSLLSLSCPTTRTCFVIAVDAVNGATATSLVIQRDGNAGRSATTIKTIPTAGESAASISCPSVTTCMAVDSSSDRTTVLLTSSGGTSWAAHALPSNVGPSIGVSCSGASDCVVAAATPNDRGIVAAQTATGGTSWSVHRVGASSDPEGSGGGISCAEGAACLLGGYGTPPSTLYASRAGAASWARHRLPAGPGPLTAVACSTAQVCVAVGAGVAVRSLDGGVSWSTAALAPPSTAALQAVACSDSSTCIAVGHATDDSGVTQGAIAYFSTDVGRTWHPAIVASGDLSLDSISCATSSTCVATSTDGRGDVLRTTSAGRTWVKVSLPGGAASHQVLLSSVSCGAAMSCVAVGSGPLGPAVELSTDAGATWQSVADVSGLGAYLQSVSCTSALTCFAAGGVQEFAPLVYTTGVYTTSDGGTDWTPVGAPASNDVTSLSCQDEVCQEIANLPGNYAPSTSTLETSVDGGAVWSASTLPVPSVLAGATAMPSSHWVLVGGNVANGALVLTTP